MNLGLRAAADKLGISHAALLKAAKGGRVTRNADGTFDVEACRAALKLNTDPVKREKEQRARAKRRQEPPAARPAAPDRDYRAEELPESQSQAEAARQREWIRVERERLNLEKLRLSLVDITPVNAYVAGMILKAREELSRLPIELRDSLAQETDPIECQKMLSDRIDQILAKMAEYRP